MNNKKAQIDTEIIFSQGFMILVGVGLIAFFGMLFILKKMDNADIMPMWVKVVTIIFIPIASYIFVVINQNR